MHPAKKKQHAFDFDYKHCSGISINDTVIDINNFFYQLSLFHI